ncbi:MAG: hypothetical protein P8Y95_04635 [Gammaproteobacteria bacterium]|jgi:hypothetical protein
MLASETAEPALSALKLPALDDEPKRDVLIVVAAVFVPAKAVEDNTVGCARSFLYI